MDLTTFKTLSIHLPAMLPPTSTELNVSHNVQVAAILGVGLLFQGTGHRHTAEILLTEIGLSLNQFHIYYTLHKLYPFFVYTNCKRP